MPSILITGANRGIGLELTTQYANQNWTVHACCRTPEKADELNKLASDHDNIQILKLDVANQDDLNNLSQSLENQPIDILFNNAGVYGPREIVFGNVEKQAWLDTFEVNTIAPLLLSQALINNIKQSDLKLIAHMSSKMGSIADNGYGKAYIYRSSKAALNAITKSMAIDLQPEGITVLAIHPGWVQTDMGGEDALINTNESVLGIMKILADKSLQHTGEMIDYAGNIIPH